MYQRIVTPLDGSEYAEAALPVAARIAQASHGTVVLLHVLSSPRELLPYVLPVMEPSTLTADVEAASAYLEAASGRADLAEVTTITEVRSGLAGSTILEVAAQQKADLVVLAAHAHTGLARWAPGKVAEHVEHHGATPVLSLTDTAALPAEGRPAQGLVLLDGTEEAEAASHPRSNCWRRSATPSTRAPRYGSPGSAPSRPTRRRTIPPTIMSRSTCARWRNACTAKRPLTGRLPLPRR